MLQEELKEAMADLAGGVATLTTAVQEAKAQFAQGTPGDVQEKLLRMAEEVTMLTDTVKRIDEAPALKRAFDVEGSIETKRLSIKKRLTLPSAVSGDDDMREFFECQDTLEILRFVKRSDSSFRIENTKTYRRMVEILATKEIIGYDGTAGQAAEWIPTGYSPDLIMKFELERQVAALFSVVNMPNDPFKIPQQTARARAYLKSRMTNPTESASTTDDITLSCQTIAAYSTVAYEVEEDAIIAMLPFIRQDLAQALADGEEDALLNGDTTGTHQDHDVTEAADVRKAWKGLRKIALAAGTTYDMGAPTTNGLRYLRSLMGKYAVSPRRLAYLVSPVGLIHLLGMDEVITMEKYGPQATVVTGELGRFDGTPVIPTGYLREDMTAAGIYDDSGIHTKTGILLLNTTGFVIGRKRSPMIESFRDVVAGMDEIVASMREDFQSRYPSDQPLVAYAIDVPNTITVGS
jgi:HK97 family phage major capsid protein